MSAYVRQALKMTIEGLAEIFDDPTLLDRSGNKRDNYGRSTHWKDFRKSADPMRVDLSNRLDDYLSWSKAAPRDVKAGAFYLSEWFDKKYPGMLAADIARTKEQPRGFPAYLTESGKKGQVFVNLISAARRLTDYFIAQWESEYPGEVFFPLVSEIELEDARNAYKRPKPGKTRSRPLPEALFAITKSILDEGVKGWPGRHGPFQVMIDGKKVYCPVMPTLFRSALELPLRLVQFRRLDSGEGDVRRFDAKTMTWKPNESPLAGYWADMEGKDRKGYPEQGYAHEFKDKTKKSITGFNINTNKTGEPYTIPWENKFLFDMWDRLVEWNEIYNPITKHLTPEQYLDDAMEIPNVTKERLPNIIPLFRLFPTKSRNWPGRIPTASEVDHSWQALMAEVERVWNLENPGNPINIVEFHPVTRQPHRSIFNPHGMRVRGLTDLFRGGMPLELLSQVVAGHATVRMTWYYIKEDPSSIDAQLTAAAIEARSKEAQDLMSSFTKMELDEAMRSAVALNDDAIKEAHSQPSNVLFTNMDLGFCPNDCSRCNDGGPLRQSGKFKNGPDKSLYDPVPGGAKNCVLCRHFVSGPPWMLQMELYGSGLLEKRKHLALEEERQADEMERLELEWRAKTLSDAEYRQRYGARTAEMRKIKEDQILTENAISNAAILLEMFRGLKPSEADGSKVPMVSASRSSVLQYIQTTDFEHSLLQTAAARVYPVLDDPRVEGYRNRILEQGLFQAGVTPPGLFPRLTDEERKRSMDLYADLLRKRTTIAERAALASGDRGLRDLEVWKEVRTLMDATLKNAIEVPDEPQNATIGRSLPLIEVLK